MYAQRRLFGHRNVTSTLQLLYDESKKRRKVVVTLQRKILS